MENVDEEKVATREDETSREASHGVILHVDDDEDVRIATAILLSTEGFEVIGAATSREAIDAALACRERLDVLLVDYHLGKGGTGTEVAESIARLLGHGIPTVILTGDPYNAEIPWLRNSPVWLIRKPADAATLIAGLGPMVTFGRAMRRLASQPRDGSLSSRDHD